VKVLPAQALAGACAVALALTGAACSSSPSNNVTTTTVAPSSTTASSTTTTTTAATTTSSSAATTSTCLPGQLSGSTGQGNGAAGTIETTVTLTNTSSSVCTLKGYPGMQLLSATGASLPTNVVRGGGQGFLAAAANQPPALVTLAPNQTASFSLSYEDVPVGTETSCPTSAKAEITPPNDTGFLVIAFTADACGGGTIHVSPVYASTT
jgi:Protein of unknown function (DUF4232)